MKPKHCRAMSSVTKKGNCNNTIQLTRKRRKADMSKYWNSPLAKLAKVLAICDLRVDRLHIALARH